jgi:hypothetical protein
MLSFYLNAQCVVYNRMIQECSEYNLDGGFGSAQPPCSFIAFQLSRTYAKWCLGETLTAV